MPGVIVHLAFTYAFKEFNATEPRFRSVGGTQRNFTTKYTDKHVAKMGRKTLNLAQCEQPSAANDWRFDKSKQTHKNKEAVIQEYFKYYTYTLKS